MTGAHQSLSLLPDPEHRECRDRLEILTALINGPSFDPMLRADVIQVPPDHPVFGWGCRVPHCERAGHGTSDLCDTHRKQWNARGGGEADRAEFLRTAEPLPLTRAYRPGPAGSPAAAAPRWATRMASAAGTTAAGDAPPPGPAPTASRSTSTSG